MSQVNIFLIRRIAFIICGLYLLSACTSTSENCNDQIKSELAKTDFFIKQKPFVLKNTINGWVVSYGSGQEILESRFSYKINIYPSSKFILLNNNKLILSDVTEGLEKEFLERINRFQNDSVKKIPNVGFQVIYPTNINIDIEQISKTICAIVKSVDELKKKTKETSNLNQEIVSSLLQLRFSFFPLMEEQAISPLGDSMSK